MAGTVAGADAPESADAAEGTEAASVEASKARLRSAVSSTPASSR